MLLCSQLPLTSLVTYRTTGRTRQVTMTMMITMGGIAISSLQLYVVLWLQLGHVVLLVLVVQVILLADILPTFIIKLTFPYFMNFIAYW